MRKLRIGQISPLNLPVPPKKYGGTEKIIYFLCEGLVKKGHEVFLFGTGDSETRAHLIEIVKKSLWVSRPPDSGSLYSYQMAVIGQKAQELKLDIIHDHLGPASLALYGQTAIPIVHTLHVPFTNKTRVWVFNQLQSKLISISYNQRKTAPQLNYVANIYNGIDLENRPFNPKPKDYFAWVGELSPRKGILEVIKIAKMAKVNLVIAGRIPPEQQKSDYLFFKKYIAKKLNKGKIKYIGEMTPKQVNGVYKNAIAFLNPLQWEEPFGLTTIESMACGTPVIAFKRGAMSEIIKDKKTGFVVPALHNKQAALRAFMKPIKEIGQIKRQDCRTWVADNFSTQRMVNEYEKLYYKLKNKNEK